MKRTLEYSHDRLFYTAESDEYREQVEVPANSYLSSIEWEDFPWEVSIHTSVSSLENCSITLVEAK